MSTACHDPGEGEGVRMRASIVCHDSDSDLAEGSRQMAETLRIGPDD